MLAPEILIVEQMSAFSQHIPVVFILLHLLDNLLLRHHELVLFHVFEFFILLDVLLDW